MHVTPSTDPVRFGAVGVSGAIGRRSARLLGQRGMAVVPVDPRGIDDDERASTLDSIDVLLVAAPLRGVTLQRTALERGVHVVDVTVDRTVEELRELDAVARTTDRAMVAMAGLAPGLTGMLATEGLAHAGDEAARVVVALLQSPTGAAGLRGTTEMLDLITDRSADVVRVPVRSATGALRSLRLFTLDNGESTLVASPVPMVMVTGFGDVDATRWMDRVVRVLRRVRSLTPSGYRRLRDVSARRKAAASGRDEETVVSVVVEDAQGDVLASRRVRVTADYDATAAVAVAVCMAAAGGALPSGAGHVRHLLASDALLDADAVRPTVVSDTGWSSARSS